ncbi:MAG: hypothetical protein QM784_37160 [Polyangiaceae bacterium]
MKRRTALVVAMFTVLAASCGEPKGQIQPRLQPSIVAQTRSLGRSNDRLAQPSSPTNAQGAHAPPTPTSVPSAPAPLVWSEPQPATEWLAFSVLETLPNLPSSDAVGDCDSPFVIAASAPKSAARNEEWFWPWVVQTLIAYDHLFEHVSNLDESDSPRDVALEEQATSRGPLSLVARCRTAETCSYLARVLRASIPGNRARLSCELPGSPTNRTDPNPPKTAAIPDLRPTYDATMSGAACARLAACSKQQDDRTNVSEYLACQSNPQRFRTRCAARTTCFDVVRCLGKKGRSLDLDPSEDFDQQMKERDAPIADGRATVDLNGEQHDFVGVSQVSDLRLAELGPYSRERWALALLNVEVSSPVEKGFSRGSYDYSVAVVDGKGHVWLAPPSQVRVEMSSATLAGGFQTAEDSAGSFDYDGDGRNELLLPYFAGNHWGQISRALEVWKFNGREVLSYPGTNGLSIIDVNYSSDSQRPDLLLEDSQWAESLPDGTFKVRKVK